jgi:hypothetical protein
MTKALTRIGCWLLLSGVLAVAGIYGWMMVVIAGITADQAMEMTGFTVVAGLAWLLFNRINRSASARRSAS